MVDKSLQNLQDIANVLRIESIKMTDISGSGHPTSCASIAEIMSVLFFHPSGMHFDPKNPKNPANDNFVLSKGHASPIYYAAWAKAGTLPEEQLKDLRKITSDVEGHPTPRLNFVDFATGSLGQGLANSAGCAYSSKYFDENPNKNFCILGDGECAEGSVWEAASFAGYYKLDNLIAIVDCNRLGQSQSTAFGHDVDLYSNRFKSFGFKTISIDGNNLEEVVNAFTEARNHTGSPVAIIAKTLKGKGFVDIEDELNFHGKPIKDNRVIEEIEKHIFNKTPEYKVTLPTNTFKYKHLATEQKYNIKLHNYEKGKKYSTREAFGFALKKLGEQDGKDKTVVVALDADVKNSTFTEPFFKEFPNKFVNCFIAEQLLVGTATGIQKRNKIPFIATFSAFYSRAYDQIRMGAISQTGIKYVGTHSGVHIGEDGPSQMGLEDIGLFRSVPHMTVLLPSDASSCERAIELAANIPGSVFIRTGRNGHEILYDSNEKFEVGKSKIYKSTNTDVISVISYGATFFEVLQAAEELKKENINIRVIDLFSVKPLDVEGLSKNIKETNNKALVVEDHYYEGGAGEAICSGLSEFGFKIYRHAVNDVPRSGKPGELYELFGLNAKHIVGYVKKALQ